jgi:GntR family transcriptional regulator
MTALPIKLSEASGVPYYRQVVDQVADLVRRGELAPGAPLPSVRDLSAGLLVSLITVRRAYADLAAAGLIVQRQGRGTFVADDVERMTRRRARSEARRVLGEALDRARQLGLGADEIRTCLADLLGDAQGKGERT